jgi:hypothetical protein
MNSLVLALALSFVAASAAAAAPQADSSVVRGDFDGDGVIDRATLVQSESKVEISIERGGTSAAVQVLEFGVGPSRQDAICQLPAELIAAPQICSPMDEPLPGCKVITGAIGLTLSDGQCDSIHLYWDHAASHMAWWRL